MQKGSGGHRIKLGKGYMSGEYCGEKCVKVCRIWRGVCEGKLEMENCGGRMEDMGVAMVEAVRPRC